MMNFKKICGTLALLAAVLLSMTCCARGASRGVERKLQCQLWGERRYVVSDNQYWEEKTPDWDLYWVKLVDQHSRPQEIRFSFTMDTAHTVFALDKNKSLLWSKELAAGTHTVEVDASVASVGFSVPDGEVVEPVGTGMHPQVQTALTGRKLSVLGDSVSSFTGYTDDLVFAYYNNDTYFGASSMWWSVLAEKTGMEICHINAVSSSGVIVSPEGTSGALRGNSNRCTQLSSRTGEAPDEIVVLLGGNDFWSVSVDQIQREYVQMLTKIQQAYPEARIHICTYYQCAALPAATLEKLNGMIRKVAQAAGVGLIDLQNCGILEKDSKIMMADETLHPSERGQILMGTCAAQQMLRDAESGSAS